MPDYRQGGSVDQDAQNELEELSKEIGNIANLQDKDKMVSNSRFLHYITFFNHCILRNSKDTITL